MKTIIGDDGLTYVLKDDMENAIKDRISKLTQKTREVETQLEEANKQISTMTKDAQNVDILTQKIRDLEGAVSKSNNQFERYKAISRHGLIDDDIIEAIEWAYERQMSKVDDKDRVDLGAWLDTQINDIDNANPLLRPHLQNINSSPENSEISHENTTGDITQVETETTSKTAEIPRVNQGATKPPEMRNIIEQGLSDPEFYEANREAIHKAYKQKYMRG